MINPKLLDSKDLERICQKSLQATGKKWVWRRIADKHGLSLEEIEANLDEKIKRNEQYMKELEDHFERVRAGQNGRDERNQLGATPDSSDTSSGINPEEFFEGEEVRSEQTQDGPVTPEGSE